MPQYHLIITHLGTPKKRRQNLVALLNEDYMGFIESGNDQATAYSKVVEKRSYKLLHGFYYQHNPFPFRSKRCGNPPYNEVIRFYFVQLYTKT